MIGEIFKALKAGQQLKDPAVWKNRQTLVNLLTVVLGGVGAVIKYKFPEIPITEDTISEIAVWLAGGVGLFNIFTTIATSKKVGMK